MTGIPHRRLNHRDFALGLAVAAAMVGTFELTTRIEDWVQYRVPLSSSYRSATQLLVRTADGIHGRPNAAYQKWRMNQFGFRGPDRDSAKAPNRLRVMTVGASETFGLFESPGKEWPRQLEDSLAVRMRGHGCAAGGVEVWNGSFPGMALPTIAQDIERRLARYHPDVIVVYPTPAFYLLGRRPEAARPDSVEGSNASHWLALRSWSRVVDQAKGLVPAPVVAASREQWVRSVRRGARRVFTELPHDRLVLFETGLRHVADAIRKAEAVPVLATHGNAFGFQPAIGSDRRQMIAWQRSHPLADSAVLVAFDSAARVRTLAFADSAGLSVADVATALARSEAPVYGDYAHLNDRGAGVLAGVVANAVVDAVAGGCGRSTVR